MSHNVQEGNMPIKASAKTVDLLVSTAPVYLPAHPAQIQTICWWPVRLV